MVQLTKDDQFILKNLLDLASINLRDASKIRATLKPFQDEKGWELVLNLHGQLDGYIGSLKEFIATRVNIDSVSLKRCQEIIKSYDAALAWEENAALKLHIDPVNRASFFELFKVERLLRVVEAAYHTREKILQGITKEYGDIETIKDPQVLKEVLMANKDYEDACRLFQYAVEQNGKDISYTDLKKERYSFLLERMDAVESIYSQMLEQEKVIGVVHENDAGWNSTARESFLINLLPENGRILFEAEVLLTERNFRIATKDKSLLTEDEQEQYTTIRSLLWIFSRKLEEETKAGRLVQSQIPPQTAVILAKVKQTDFYKENNALVKKEPNIWNNVWVQGAGETYVKLVELFFPLSFAGMKSLRQGYDADTAGMAIAKLGLTAGGAVVDAAALILLKGAVQRMRLAGRLFAEEGIREGAKRLVLAVPAKIAEEGVTRFAVKTTAKAALLAFPYYHSFKDMETVLEDKQVSTEDKVFAVARFLKEVMVFEQLFAKGPAAILRTLRSPLREEAALAKIYETKFLKILMREAAKDSRTGEMIAKNMDEIAMAAAELAKTSNAKLAQEIISDLGRRLGVKALEKISLQAAEQFADSLLKKVVAHATTMAFGMALTQTNKVTEMAVDKKEKSEQEKKWSTEYKKLAFTGTESILLSEKEYIELRRLGRDETKEGSFTKDTITSLLKEYGEYVSYCQSENQQSLSVLNYLHLRLYYPDMEKDTVFTYTKEYANLDKRTREAISFPAYVRSNETAKQLLGPE